MKTLVARSMIIIVLLATNLVVKAQFNENTSIGGYGELHFNKADGSQGVLDFHRFVVYVGHAFSDELTLKSEFELEHTRIEAGDEKGGEVAIEQAYLDWHFSNAFGLRAGIILLPVGLLNEFHEPSTFNGVERTAVERNVIPATWREAGAGVYGSFMSGVSYQLYVMAGLKASGFSGSSGIRGGRQEGFESSTENPAVTGKVEFRPMLDLTLGGSFFIGNSVEGSDSLGRGLVSVTALHTTYAVGYLSARALGAYISISDAQNINAYYGNGVADRLYGGYVEVSYNVLPLLNPESLFSLDLFGRIERYNTQARVSGIQANPLFDRTDVTLGLTFRPTYNTVVKTDYQFFHAASGSDTKQFNVGVGYNF